MITTADRAFFDTAAFMMSSIMSNSPMLSIKIVMSGVCLNSAIYVLPKIGYQKRKKVIKEYPTLEPRQLRSFLNDIFQQQIWLT